MRKQKKSLMSTMVRQAQMKMRRAKVKGRRKAMMIMTAMIASMMTRKAKVCLKSRMMIMVEVANQLVHHTLKPRKALSQKVLVCRVF